MNLELNKICSTKKLLTLSQNTLRNIVNLSNSSSFRLVSLNEAVLNQQQEISHLS